METSGASRGVRRSPEYEAWAAMKTRCYNPRFLGYARYGGRGITVCERWRGSFEAFLSDMGRRPSADHSIDRIDNDGNYEPRNCRWATREEQARNRVQNIFVTYLGQRMCLLDACRASGRSYKAVASLIYAHGGDPQEVFDRPVNRVKSLAAYGLCAPPEMLKRDCARGHLFTPENTYNKQNRRTGRTARVCLACNREQCRQRRADRKVR